MSGENGEHLVDGKYAINDLIDLDRLRVVFEKFTLATGFTIGFLDHPGLNVLVATGWRDICTKYHRVCPAALDSCARSNRRLLDQLDEPGKLVIDACDNGLVDCATPIIIKGKHIASLATGQLLLDKPDLKRFRRQAREWGCDEAAYMEALKEVPVVSEENLRDITSFLGEIASIISELGYVNLKVKREAEQAEQAVVMANRLAVKAEAANKAKDEFLANTSHELRTPLNAILGFSQLLVNSGLNPRQKEWLGIVINRGKDLLDIINNILELARIEADGHELCDEPFSLRGAVEDTIELFLPTAREKKLQLGWEIGGGVPDSLVGDHTRLKHLLRNLVGNAVKFTDSGEVDLSIELENPAAAADGRPSVELVISVSDTGIGISKEDLERIFLPFSQLDPSSTKRYDGAGLGLAICKRLVGQLGGRIKVDSELGKGSVFRVSLSFKKAAPEPSVATGGQQ